MRLAIMQPYFLPYLGYWQLLGSVDMFVIHDDVEYTKKGWINRNRILANGLDCYITLPLRKDSDYLTINRRFLTPDFFDKDAPSMLRKFESSYRKAPFREEGSSLLKACLSYRNFNLFDFLRYSIQITSETLKIYTPIVASSRLSFDRRLRGQDRVIAICESVGAKQYINPPGGKHLYDAFAFSEKDIELYFIQPQILAYPQALRSQFFENLSILDAISHIGVDSTIEKLIEFKLV